MHGHHLPTAKTLAAKLQAAKEALKAGRLLAVDSDRHVAADMEELGVDEDAYWALIPQLIEAALTTGAEQCYAGGHPPIRSSKHPAIKNLELWAYKVAMPGYSKPLYFKFALKPHPKTKELTYCHVDCHPDK